MRRSQQASRRGLCLVLLALGTSGSACGSDETIVAAATTGSTGSGGSRVTGVGGEGASGQATGGQSTTHTAGQSGQAGEATTGAGAAGSSATASSASVGGSGGTGSVVVPEPTVVDLTLDFEAISLPGTSRTVDFHFLPGTTDELYVLGHTGELSHYRITGNDAELLAQAEIPNTLQAKGCGATSFTLDPLFVDNSFVYIARCVNLVDSTLSRYETDDFANLGESEAELFTVSLPWDRDEWHRFGSMGFESDQRTLWILVGDMFFPEYAQDTTTKNGSLVRIVPNRDPDAAGYAPAFGNAFTADSGNDPDIFAYGIRSPWRGTRDRFGRFWFGDVGHQTAEEVNLATEPGQNFGWDAHEGPCEVDCAGLRDPVLWYGRGNGRAIWVGEMYENPTFDRYYGVLTDTVFYGDYYNGWVNGFTANEHGSVISDREYGSQTDITQWRVGNDGYMYALTYTPVIYRAIPDPVYADE